MTNLPRLSIILMLAVLAVVPSLVRADDVKDRIASFQASYSADMIAAIKLLSPVDDPKIVDVIANVYADEDTRNHRTYDPAYMTADDIMLTARTSPVFARIHEYLSPKKHPRMRLHFMLSLAALKHETTLPVIAKIASQEKDEAVQYYMAKALGNYNEEDAYLAMFRLAQDSLSSNVSRIAVMGLAGMKNERTTELLWRLYNDGKKTSGMMRAECLNSLFIRKDENVDGIVSAAIDDKSPEVRLAAITIAADTGRDDLNGKIISSLYADEWQVRSAAVRACEKLKIEASIGPLIELWKKETGRVEEDIHRALLVITGKSFGPDWRYWDAWFSNLSEPPKAADKAGDYVSYHGLKTKSKNIAFVIDHSGSMSEKVKSKHDGYAGEGAVAKDDTKMAMVQAELIRVIKSLPEDTLFNIVAFDDKVIMYSDSQVKADKANKESAIKWVDRLAPGGQTNIYDALVDAFGRVTKGGKANTEYKTGPDTIFLLSDGLPNTGTVFKAPDLLQGIKDMNRIRQVTIHTIGVGNGTKMLLEPLAAQNGGTFKLIAE